MWGMEIIFIRPGIYKLVHPLTGFSDRILFGTVYHGIGTLLPVYLTTYCYVKVYKTLKEAYQYNGFEVKPSRVLWYSAIQILCFVPEMVIDTFFLCKGEEVIIEGQVIMFITKKSWPFLNLLAYWFFTPAGVQRESVDVDESKVISRETLL